MTDKYRREYRELKPEEQNAIGAIKIQAESMEKNFDVMQGDLGADPRCLAIARTKLEEAIMWATKGVTQS